MAEYIERGVLIDALNQVTNDPTCPLNIAADVYQVATETPAADVRLERHGEWVHLGGDEWGCSCCGYVISTESSREHPMGETLCDDFCRKCGAKMKAPYAET